MTSYSCGANLARLFLVIFNLIFVIVGLALIVVGGLLKAGAGLLDVLGDFVKQIPGLGNIAIGIVVLGSVIFLIGIFGTCGACCSIKCMLIMYGVIVIIITVAEIIIVALFFSGTFDKTVTDGFRKLTKRYKMPNSLSSIDKTDVISRLIDAVFIVLKCCEYEDIPNRNNKIPPTCCKGVTRAKLESGDISTLATCQSSPDLTNSYKDKGCTEALLETIKNNQAYVIGIGVALLVVELLCIVFAFLICHQIGKDNRVSPL